MTTRVYKTMSFMLASLLSLTVSSCSSDDGENEPPAQSYLGTHTVNLVHYHGIVEKYDEVGNPLGSGIDTFYHQNHEYRIEASEDSDSLNIVGLYNSVPFRSDIIKGFIDEDTLRLYRQEDNIIAEDNVRGTIYHSTDSIFVTYRWDKTNKWASNAIPYYGIVSGTGSR